MESTDERRVILSNLIYDLKHNRISTEMVGRLLEQIAGYSKPHDQLVPLG